MTARTSRCCLLAFIAIAAGCQGPEETEPLAEELRTKCARPKLSIDFDGDGLDDKWEGCLLEERAPVVHFSNGERHLPANVEWTLARSGLNFRHGARACHACPVVAQGQLGRPQLTTARHASLQPWQNACAHDAAKQVSITEGNGNPPFFLGLPESAETGAASSSAWRVYGHVYPDGKMVHIQYWFLYPHSDGILTDDHQGDWEQITVRVDGQSGEEIDVIYCAHGECPSVHPQAISWWGTHPAVYVAHGTHGNFASRLSCDRREKKAPVVGHLGIGCKPGGRTWFTGRGSLPGLDAESGGGIVNVGERAQPLFGQEFIQANLRWGSDGNSPPTMSFQGTFDWKGPDIAQPVGGPGGGGGCEDSCGPNRERVPGTCGECRCSTTVESDCARKTLDEPNIPWKWDSTNCECFIDDGRR